MGSKNAENLTVYINIGGNQAFCFLEEIRIKICLGTCDNRVFRKYDYTGLVFITIIMKIPGEEKIGELQMIADISDIRFRGVGRFVKFLEAYQVRILFSNQFQHGQAMTRGAGFFCTEFIPSPHIPCHDTDAAGIFNGKIIFSQAETAECMDILPSDKQANQRNHRIAGAGEEPEN